MPIIGIITEFNPFHNGHAHLLHTLRRQPQATLICIMSGPFTQRGEAALMSKYSRAQMALHNGADLVVELPFFYAVRSAYDFARGGIHLLHCLGIEQLGFGCETSNESLLKTLTALLAHEPKAYTDSLHKHLKTGCGFAAARTLALQEMFPDNAPSIAQLLHAPNTILALEYLRVLQEEELSIQPQMILRQGAGYHDEALQEFASAQAIRTYLRQQAFEDTMPLQKAMPPTAYTLLQQELHAGRAPFQTALLDAMILSQLRKSHPQELATIFEMREGIENRLFKQAFSCGTIEDLVQAVSGRRYPKSRIRRLLLYTLLGLTQTQAQLYQALYAPDYVRLLAANARGLKYIQQLQRKTPAPTFLSSGREIRRFLQQTAPELSASQQMLQLDLTANNLYTLGYPQASQRSGDTDFHQSAFFL